MINLFTSIFTVSVVGIEDGVVEVPSRLSEDAVSDEDEDVSLFV